MIMIFSALITLMITLTGQHVYGEIITVNTRGNDSIECCAMEQHECPYSSLSRALECASNNTIINITSNAMMLKGNITIGLGYLNNITITSQFTTITCNNTTIYCESCDNVTLRGITLVDCNFSLSNSTIVNCTLMHNNVMVSGGISIIQSELSDTSLSRINNTDYNGYVNLTITGSIVYSLIVSDSSCLVQWNITITNTTFTSSLHPTNFQVPYNKFSVCADILHGMRIANITVTNISFSTFSMIEVDLNATEGNIIVSLLSSVFINNSANAIQCTLTTHSEDSSTSVLISDTEFTNNAVGRLVDLYIKYNFGTSIICLKNVNFTDNYSLTNSLGILFISSESRIEVYMINVNFMGNNFLGSGSGMHIQMTRSNNHILLHHCRFTDNKFPDGSLIIVEQINCVRYASNYSSITFSNCSVLNNKFESILISGKTSYYIEILNSVFVNNLVGYCIFDLESDSVHVNISMADFIGNFIDRACMYIPKHSSVNSWIYLTSSQFINNIGVCLYVSLTQITLTSSNFTNNIGGCIVMFDGGQLILNGNILFDDNSANQGAALFLFGAEISVEVSNGSNVHFVKNSATQGGAIFVYVDQGFVCSEDGAIFVMEGNAKFTFTDNIARAGDSLFFSISSHCKIYTNTSNPASLMHIPYRFTYTELNSTDCCEVSCFNKHNAKFPVITSPHNLLLCGDSMEQLNNNTYFIGNVILGKPATFRGSIMDYFKKPSMSVQFSLNCTTCSNDITLSSSEHISVDNTSPLSLTFFGNELNSNINVTVVFTSLMDSYMQPIIIQVIIEIVPCFDHIGYAYSRESNGCTCYLSSVLKCSEHYNEIEDGYWIGVISSQPTTSLCPSHYCSFIHRNKFTLGYSELPDDVDAQCNHHRRGRACGECSPGYTLAYDTTDCISVNQCSTILTVVVIASTCAYWVIIVVGVFALLYFNKCIPLGYTYAVIYYYSIVGVLFSSNMYISESAFLLISVMSSFMQLSPQFLGTLCLVKGLSGIDQLFIHYSHPIAVSLLVAMFVIAAKFSHKLSDFVSRCRIVRIICVLLLLLYTSIVSTSLQLLWPLTFTNIQQVYTYSSPSIQYFHDQHIIYGIVAIVCELVVGIGLPLLLLLEPFINKKINFVKIKPLLDEFQDCYKEKRKYRWFASYYLICRQIILLIVLIGNNDYSRLFLLLITCIIIATIHMWIRPYKSTLLNLFDGLILQLMAVGVSINIFTFLQPAATELVLVLVAFPLFVMCIVGIAQVIQRKLHGGQYMDNNDVPRNDGSDEEYQEPLLGFVSVNN